MSALATLIHFPVAVWTVLVAISLVYWMFVMIGLVHLGEGAPELGDASDLGDAGHEAIGHDAADVGHEAPGHQAAGAEGHDLGADDAPGGLAGYFRLRNVPLMVAASLVSFFAWVLTLLALVAIGRLGWSVGALGQSLVAFVAAPILAFPLAKLATRPLAPLLTPRRARSARDLIGQSCVIRTGSADERFGEATVKDTGPDLVLRVRVEGASMKRGEEGVIVGFDEEREEYLVAPLDERGRS